MLLFAACSQRAEPEVITEDEPPVVLVPPRTRNPIPVYDYPVMSQWGTSKDGAVSLRIQAPTVIAEGENVIHVSAEVRNNTMMPLVLKRLFSNAERPAADGLELTGPRRRIPLAVSRSSIHFRGNRFEVVPPGESIVNQVTLSVKVEKSDENPQTYGFRFIYRATLDDRRAAEAIGLSDLWTGEVESGWTVAHLGVTRQPTAFEESVSIEFPKAKYDFTLDEVAKGVRFEYEIVVASDLKGVIPIPQDMGHAAGGGPSGLKEFEEIWGNCQSYALRDIGLGSPIPYDPITIRRGRYASSFEWHGRNWDGPSDTSNPQGPPFPPESYTLTVRLLGYIDTADGRKIYHLTHSVPIVLKP
jgi:hypothetical protein